MAIYDKTGKDGDPAPRFTASNFRLKTPAVINQDSPGSAAQGPIMIELKRHGAGFSAPGQTPVRVNDAVMFTNSTGGLVTIQFANSELFGQEDLTLDPDGSQTLYVEDVQVSREMPSVIYPFAVFCYARTKFARGNSMPVIIVNKD